MTLPTHSDLIDTFWIAPYHESSGTQAVYRVAEVEGVDNTFGQLVPMVYAERLDAGSRYHPPGRVRKVSVVGVFTTHHRRITEAEAREASCCS